MKRILIFSLNYYPFVGGAEVAIKEITDRIPPDEVEFHLIAYKFDGALLTEERMGNVQVHRVGWGRRGTTVAETFTFVSYLAKVLYVPLAALKAASLMRRLRFDGAWAMMTYMIFPLALLRLGGVRPQYLVTLQEGDPFERVFERRRIRIVAPLLFYGLRRAAAVQAISTFLAAWARRCGYEGPVEVIPNGVDTARFALPVSVEERGSVRAALGGAPEDVLLVTTSRLVRKNGIDTVIEALPRLPERVRFVVYGTGPEEAKLRTLAHSLGVTGRVLFMGHVGHAELPGALAACDIFIRPSRSEGMGNSFIEAMAAGLPVIATQEGGIADFLFDEKRDPGKDATGWAVDSDAPEQIAERVLGILADPERTRGIVARARALATSRYDWERIAGEMRALFDRTFA